MVELVLNRDNEGRSGVEGGIVRSFMEYCGDRRTRPFQVGASLVWHSSQLGSAVLFALNCEIIFFSKTK